MKSFQQLAQAAYEAYQAEGVKQNGGKPFPWTDLEPGHQACWVKAVQKVVAEVAAIQ
ncbi:hypothetical protein [Polaromonas sp. UC242_47]|uniref:hypothetical protein n=1 Tax=Polaromonas sp. UC242_47 TaxID=3374626 RepID=UPI0037A66695